MSSAERAHICLGAAKPKVKILYKDVIVSAVLDVLAGVFLCVKFPHSLDVEGAWKIIQSFVAAIVRCTTSERFDVFSDFVLDFGKFNAFSTSSSSLWPWIVVILPRKLHEVAKSLSAECKDGLERG